jgi:hypothetical protein
MNDISSYTSFKKGEQFERTTMKRLKANDTEIHTQYLKLIHNQQLCIIIPEYIKEAAVRFKCLKHTIITYINRDT